MSRAPGRSGSYRNGWAWLGMATMQIFVANCKCDLTRMEAVDHGAGPVVGHAHHALQQGNQTHPRIRPSRTEETNSRGYTA